MENYLTIKYANKVERNFKELNIDTLYTILVDMLEYHNHNSIAEFYFKDISERFAYLIYIKELNRLYYYNDFSGKGRWINGMTNTKLKNVISDLNLSRCAWTAFHKNKE